MIMMATWKCNSMTILLLLWQLGALAQAQVVSIELVDSIELTYKASEVFVDRQGQVYVLSTKNELLQINAQGKTINNYREQVNGTPSSVDFTNQLSIYLYFPDVSQMVELDNMLSPKSRLSVSAQSFGDQSLICRSFDNNFWKYEERSFRLRKIDFNLQTVIEGQWFQNNFSDFQPIKMTEYGKNVYLNDPEIGILVFDLYGSYIKTIPIKNVKTFAFSQTEAVFLSDTSLFVYNLLRNESQVLFTQQATHMDWVAANDNKIYLLASGKVLIYKLLRQ